MIISGIQQVGIGNPNTPKLWKWYRKAFGVDVPVFDEAAEAPLMIDYTGDKVRSRHAVLALNMQGGGGFEIWQFTDRESAKANFDIKLGDLGINITKVKAKNIQESYKYYQDNGIETLGEPKKGPDGKMSFFMEDPYSNIFQVVESDTWFTKNKHVSGGVLGSVIGVSNIDASVKLYSDVLGYDKVVYDKTGEFEDLKDLKGGDRTFRRVLLTHSENRVGAFSKLLGPSYMELIELQDAEATKIFQDRYWGDQGFIHLCFDINGMDELKKKCESAGYNFTVDSNNSFEMENAAGRFAYIEDNDGTLIEFVETHKVPIHKKLGLSIDLTKRKAHKPLPNLLIKGLALARVKD